MKRLAILLFALAGFSVAWAQNDHASGPVVFPTTNALPEVAVDLRATGSPASVDPSQPTPVPDPSTSSVARRSTATPEDIYDIRPPFFYLHSWLWLWIALGVAALIALLIALWKWFRPIKAQSPKTAYDLTLEKLEKARLLLDEADPQPYAVLVSEIIRGYLSQRFQTPSTRRTTEEFLRQMQTDQNTPLAEHRDLLRGFLESCDLVKFARYLPGREELEEVHRRALVFVSATRPVEQNGVRP